MKINLVYDIRLTSEAEDCENEFSKPTSCRVETFLFFFKLSPLKISLQIEKKNVVKVIFRNIKMVIFTKLQL